MTGVHVNARWSPEHDAALKSLHAAGASGSECAAKINQEFRTRYSRNAVIGRKHRLGMTEATTRRKPKIVKRASPKNPLAPKFVEPRPDREEIELRCAEVVPRNIPLIELASGDCKYPYGDGPFTFCGCPAVGEGPYCAPHQALSERVPR